MHWIALGIGGALGTWARYALSKYVQISINSFFPFGTMIVNGLGCFIAGFLFFLLVSKNLLTSNVRLFSLIGFCGAFTTYSTYILESVLLMKDGQLLFAFINILLTLVGSILLFFLGSLLAQNI